MQIDRSSGTKGRTYIRASRLASALVNQHQIGQFANRDSASIVQPQSSCDICADEFDGLVQRQQTFLHQHKRRL